MSIKLLTASVSLAAGTGSTGTATVLQSQIDDLIDDDRMVPLTLLFSASLDDKEISLSKVVVKKVKNDEDAVVALQVDPAAPTRLDNLNASLGPDGAGIAKPKMIPTRHGLKIEIEGDNANASAQIIVITIAVNNPHGGEGEVGRDPQKGQGPGNKGIGLGDPNSIFHKGVQKTDERIKG